MIQVTLWQGKASQVKPSLFFLLTAKESSDATQKTTTALLVLLVALALLTGTGTSTSSTSTARQQLLLAVNGLDLGQRQGTRTDAHLQLVTAAKLAQQAAAGLQAVQLGLAGVQAAAQLVDELAQGQLGAHGGGEQLEARRDAVVGRAVVAGGNGQAAFGLQLARGRRGQDGVCVVVSSAGLVG
ncbi:hypothetical protein BD289DRAFT_499319, partial [Coniella lustricola]